VNDSVLIGGVFDPLHAGHLAYIKEAQGFGVAVDCALSDAPQKHPVLIPLKQRAKLLRALGVRDVYEHQSAADLPDMIRALKPKAYIKGNDWAGGLPAEQVIACAEVGAGVVFTNTVTHSSSELLANYERRRNTEKLAAFEAFVQHQQPAEKPWEPVTDYCFEARKEIEGPHAQIIKDTFGPDSVLDVGCGEGHLMTMLEAIGVRCRGMDPRTGSKFLTDRIGYDSISEEWPNEDWGHTLTEHYRSGLVICREVLEHLTVEEIAVAVRNLVKLSCKFVYLTTRFTAKSHLLDFDNSDSLDPTHITMLNQDLLRTLFVLEGCTRRADLEARLDWQHKGRVLVYEVPRD
jgi:cytidyltransferase-like protein